MSTTCQHCGGKTDSAYLCARCCDRLRETLAKLPALLEALTDAAVGAVKMGDNGGRKSARKTTLEIARSLGTVTGTGEHADQQARTAREAMLRKALASGGCNAGASLLLGTVADELGAWCRMLCDERGMSYEPPTLTPWRDTHGNLHAPSYGEAHVRFLFANVAAIALSDSAGDIMGDICGRDHVRRGYAADIEQAVDRPVRWRSLGRCPAEVRLEGPNVDGEPHPTTECAAPLRVSDDNDTQTVRCPRCKTKHVVAWLNRHRMAEAEGALLTADELVRVNRDQPANYRVPERTLRHWRQSGRLMPRDMNEDGDPLYSWLDVRLLRPRKPQHATTGAAAHA